MAKKSSSHRVPRAKRSSEPIGNSQINASDLKGLRLAWNQKQLVLFLGAGISIASGIPSWKNLVLEMLFDQTEHAKRLKTLFPHYRRSIGEWLADYFEYDPIILARIIEDEIRQRPRTKGKTKETAFLLNLQQHLYSAYDPAAPAPTLGAVSDFIARSRGNIHAVVNFNFDDLLEGELARRNVDHIPVYTNARLGHEKLRVTHPHGFIPRVGIPKGASVVFTERSYHSLTETVFHWALTEIVSHLRHQTVLFIGMSMSDPSLRRLLDACRNSNIPPHWQIQKRHEIRDHEQQDAKEDIERRARDWGSQLGYREIKSPQNLSEIINSALRQADTYDRRLFEDMGVKTVWLNDFDDIPFLLKAIA